MEHKVEDRSLKELGKLYSNGLKDLIGYAGTIVKCLDTKITGVTTEKEMDLLLETDMGTLLNIEFQSTFDNWKENMRRFRYYSASTMLATGKDVATYIIYNKNCKSAVNDKLLGSFGTFRVNNIYLGTINLEEELDFIEKDYKISKTLSEYSKVILVLSSGLYYTNDNIASNMERVVKLIKLSEDKEGLEKLFTNLAGKFLDLETLNLVKGELSMVDVIKEFKEEGKIEGKREAIMDTIKNMLNLGLDEVIIEKSTGASIEEIRKIKEYIKE